MKLTKNKLKQIIKEELQNILKEQDGDAMTCWDDTFCDEGFYCKDADNIHGGTCVKKD